MSTSRRHHYIPQFYTEKFQSEDGYYYVYDKLEDKIKRYHSPKMFFYENHRNSFVVNGEQNSFIEDELYKLMDSQCSVFLANIRDAPNDDYLINDKTVFGVSILLMNLFWRIPKFDNLYEDFFSRGNAYLVDDNGNRIVDEELIRRFALGDRMKKIERFFLFRKIIQSLPNVKERFRSYKVVEFGDNSFLLGDYPMVYRLPLARLESIINEWYYLPLSPKRVIFTGGSSLNFTLKDAIDLNVIVIHQSVRYVCGPDKELLRGCVDFYNDIKDKNLTDIMKFRLFRENR